MSTTNQMAVLNLDGPFQLTAPDGFQFYISEKKNKALLAMVATAVGQRRSRQWLKGQLWSRTREPQNSYSMRQAIRHLRKTLQGHGDFFHVDREFVWLTNVRVIRPGSSDKAGQFFSDAKLMDPPFLDWLQRERLNIARAHLKVATSRAEQAATYRMPGQSVSTLVRQIAS